LLKLIKKGKIKIFSIYCILIGLIIVILNLWTYLWYVFYL
jgi:undecaprenyl pyrophosphate phosphatase UppP